MNKTVFLGGTCNGSNWRDLLIPHLKIDYFNPVVPDWTPECQQREIDARKNSDYVLYVITPNMLGAYSVAEVVDDSNKRPGKTLFIVLEEDYIANESSLKKTVFDKHALKSLNMVKKMVVENGAKVFNTLKEAADFLNK